MLVERTADEGNPYSMRVAEETLRRIVPSNCTRSANDVSPDEKDGPVQFVTDRRELSAVDTEDAVFIPGVCDARGVMSGPSDVSTCGTWSRCRKLEHSILLDEDAIFVFDPGR
jgi:hypothetical protein